ncbi:GerMN domain-containing protein [Austwickia chelonae]|uniref:GerMN domain-containing protein n=1 Tax=Austwickia chelonae TaxID=100225 RepID=UPI000E2378C1|nr:GerMN domain-containing protein [Austwickia chelonae]
MTARGQARRRRALLGAVLTTGMLLGASACGGLPVSSEVMPGDNVSQPLVPPVRQHPAGPQKGADPQSIVSGFLLDGSAQSEDYRAAREYLAAGTAERWVPRAHPSYLYSGKRALTIQPGAETQGRLTVRVSAEVTAMLGADGRYTEYVTPEKRSVEFHLTQVSGQWRISQLPEDFGVWLDTFYFDRSHQPFTVGYSSPIGRTIIPDRRFFPVSGALLTALARAQLDPIPPYLQGAVTTGFPTLTKLSVDAVTVQDGLARLDLTSAALDSRAEERRAALAQAITTMTQVTAVAGVSLQVDDRPLEVIGVAAPPNELSQLGYQTAPGPNPGWVVVRQGARLMPMHSGDLRSGKSSAQGPYLPSIDPAYSKLAVSSDMHDIAAVSADGRALLRWRQNGDPSSPGQSATQPPFAVGMTRPTYDSHHGLWVGGALPSGGAGIWVIDTRGEVEKTPARQIEAPWLAGATILNLSVSTDSQRLAMVLRERDGRVRIAVSGVVRGQDERPQSLTAPVFLGGRIVDAVDVTWSSPYQLAVLGRAGQGQDLRALSVGLEGRTEVLELPPVPGAKSIVALGSGQLGIVGGDGRLHLSIAGRWQEATAATDVMAP